MAFSLHISALKILRRLRVESQCASPVAALSKRTKLFDAHDELREAFLSQDADKLQEATKNEWERTSSGLEFFLDVFFYEKATFRAEEVVDIDGIAFEIPAFIGASLNGVSLHYENGFVLRDQSGEIVDLPFPTAS